MSRVAIFCDVQSLWYNAKYWGEARVDYSKLLMRLADGRDIAVCNAYLVEGPAPLDAFERALQHMGYNTAICSRSNVESMIADALRATPPEVSTVVMATATGPRYADVVRDLRAAGKRVELWSFPISGPSTHILSSVVDEHRLLDQSVLKAEVAHAG